MKKPLKIFGAIILLSLIWSIIFSIFADRSQEIWADLGVLEVLPYLLAATIGSFKEFIVSVIIFSILIILKKKKKIKLDNNILFILGYAFIVIFNLILTSYLISLTSMSFNIERLTFIIFVPIIHSLISYNLISFLLKKK